MQMGTLYVDAGNTRVKCAVSTEDGWDMVHVGTYTSSLLWQNYLLEAVQSNHIICTSVSDVFDAWLNTLADASRINFRVLTSSDIPAARLDYETPHTLGTDRWLACSGAFSISQQAVVVCTAGTAVTVDLMDQTGVFRGGVIMPGVDAIESSAHKTAHRLPIGDVLNDIKIPARSTDDSVDAGARFMLQSALNAILDRYESSYGRLRIWVAGGRSDTLQSLISREVRTDPYLVFRGMKELDKINSTNDF